MSRLASLPSGRIVDLDHIIMIKRAEDNPLEWMVVIGGGVDVFTPEDIEFIRRCTDYNANTDFSTPL